jgi:hypothetical protein
VTFLKRACDETCWMLKVIEILKRPHKHTVTHTHTDTHIHVNIVAQCCKLFTIVIYYFER